MNGDTPFRWILGLIFLTAIAISGYHRHKARRSGEAIARGRESPALIAVRIAFALPLMLSLAAWLIEPAWMDWSRLPLPRSVQWIGVAMGLMTVPAVYWVVRTLGRNISETILTKTDHELVTRGPYRWVRHPLYTAGILLLSSAALVTANGFIAVTTACAALLIRTVVVPKEEAALTAMFGDRYVVYRTRTGALLPRLGTSSRDPA